MGDKRERGRGVRDRNGWETGAEREREGDGERGVGGRGRRGRERKKRKLDGGREREMDR